MRPLVDKNVESTRKQCFPIWKASSRRCPIALGNEWHRYMNYSCPLSVWIIEINCIQQILWKSPQWVECPIYQDAGEVKSTLLAAAQDCTFPIIYLRIWKPMRVWEKNSQGSRSFRVLPKLSVTSSTWEMLAVRTRRVALAHPGQNQLSAQQWCLHTSALVQRFLSKPVSKLECPVDSRKPWFCSYLAIDPSHYLLLSNLMNKKPFPGPHLPHRPLPFRRSHPLLCPLLRVL